SRFARQTARACSRRARGAAARNSLARDAAAAVPGGAQREARGAQGKSHRRDLAPESRRKRGRSTLGRREARQSRIDRAVRPPDLLSTDEGRLFSGQSVRSVERDVPCRSPALILILECQKREAH